MYIFIKAVEIFRHEIKFVFGKIILKMVLKIMLIRNIFFFISLQITKNVAISCCRAVFNKDEQFITDKRIKLDKVLAKIPGIKFFISCMTATATTGKEIEMGVSPGISFFIAYDAKVSNEEIIYAHFHDLNVVEEFELKTMKRSNNNNEMLNYLSRTVKVITIYSLC